MPAVQSTYGLTIAAARAGMIANEEQLTNVISRIVDSAGAIGFGKVVVQSSEGDEKIKVPTAGGAFRGITVRDVTLRPDDNDQYAVGESAAVLTKGVIWVLPSVAVAAGDPVYFTAAGALTNVPTSNTQIIGALWDSAGSGSILAKLRLA
ncbi:MAG: DUF2190 family protein [Methylocystis sp.]